jgi:uncharacterized protein YbjQ (UPF0145 family)
MGRIDLASRPPPPIPNGDGGPLVGCASNSVLYWLESKPAISLTPFMIITTTPNIEGKRIKEYLGIVTGEAVVGANLFRDLFAGLRDIVGGRSGAYEKELRKARNLAFEEITEAAQELGANAIVGVDIDYEVLGEKNGMLMVSVSGTAVIVE